VPAVVGIVLGWTGVTRAAALVEIVELAEPKEMNVEDAVGTTEREAGVRLKIEPR
jgi:hypothetical protein